MDRFRSSSALLAKPFRPSEPGFDEIFLLAAVKEEKGRVTIAIDDKTPTVALNDGVRVKHNLGQDIPTVAEVQKQHGASPYMLISGGVHFWLSSPGEKDKALLLQRDEGAKLLPLHWTETAGRCDRNPKLTCDNEGNEELLVMMKKAGAAVFRPVVIADTAYEGKYPLELKRKQIDAKLAPLAAQGLQQKDIDASQVHLANYSEMPHEKGLYRDVVVVVNGKAQDPVRMMCLFDPANNTLEMRRSAAIDVKPGDKVVAVDGEKFGRLTGKFTMDQIVQPLREGVFKACPALAMYIQHAT